MQALPTNYSTFSQLEKEIEDLFYFIHYCETSKRNFTRGRDGTTSDPIEKSIRIDEVVFPTKLEWYRWFKSMFLFYGYTLKETAFAYKQFMKYHGFYYRKSKDSHEFCQNYLDKSTWKTSTRVLFSHTNKFHWEFQNCHHYSPDVLEFITNEILPALEKTNKIIFETLCDYKGNYGILLNCSPFDLHDPLMLMEFGVAFKVEIQDNVLYCTPVVREYKDQNRYYTILGKRIRDYFSRCRRC